MDDFVANFSEDIEKEILLRCPVKSLLRFKCVCKKWYALIKTPKFAQQHLNCSKNKPPQLMLYNVGDPFYSRSLTLLSEENPQTFQGMTHLFGSVDGLFFMIGWIEGVLSCALWNPAIREVRPLHLPPSMINAYPVFGLGLDPLTNDYKVVCYSRKNTAAVYSCSRDSWRIFKPKILFFRGAKDTFGTTYSNGTYYWLLGGGDHYSLYTILSFNFGSETFEDFKGPHIRYVREGVLGMMLVDDSIAILNPRYTLFYYDIWVMIQPGIWNKLITFQCFPEIKSCYDSSLILVTRASRLVSYNVRTNKTRRLGFQHSSLKNLSCRFSYYKESLVTIQRQAEDGEQEN